MFGLLAIFVFVSCGENSPLVSSDYGEGVSDGSQSGDNLTKGVARVHGGFLVPRGSGWPPSIAIVDTGIDTFNSDLNLVGGINCTSADRNDWQDTDGHGTSLAGVAAAKRDGEGFIGVAPGAQLYSVRVFANEMLVSEESVLCGLQWIYENADKIDVALVSFNRRDDALSDDSTCRTSTDSLREVICKIVDAGVTVVAAAGNQKANANDFVPAKLDEVITVGALVDFDGVPGGFGLPTCGPGVDDSIADFSNTGPAVDIYAPGVCIETIMLASLGDAVEPSGSSLAAAHVAGAAAVHMACYVDATPSEVRDALLDTAEIVQVDNSEIPVVSIYPFCFAEMDEMS